jgi:hypothetical protein
MAVLQLFSLRVHQIRLVAVGVLVLAFAGCGTIDPGPDTGPPAGCNAPAAFFVSDMWPKYFDTYKCGQSDCHDASNGHGYFRLQSVAGLLAPQPTDPLSVWPQAWTANLKSVQHNVSCANPTNSAVLIIPSGRGQPHPPGVTVLDIPAADELFLTWLK